MSDCEIVPADKVPGGRCYRFVEINRLEIGEAVFVSDDDIGRHTLEPAHLMRQHAYYRGKLLGRKFRTRRGMYKAMRGTFVIRVS